MTLHLLAVIGKLAILFVIPRLKSAEQAQRTLNSYKKMDIWLETLLWSTGLGFFFVSSFAYLMQLWMIVSMLLYVLAFYIVKRILLRGLQNVVDSGKVFAEKELRTLRVQNGCVAIFILCSLAGIGYLMVVKPF